MKLIKLTFVFALFGILFYSCQEDSLTIDESAITQERVGDTDLNKGRSASIVNDLNTITVEQLVDAIIGSGPNAPVVSNVTFIGRPTQAGIFTDVTNVFGFSDGIVLSSGLVNYIQGPNISDGISAITDYPGDLDLNGLIPGHNTYDAAVLEFDFECTSLQEISFEYVFSSEEYNEWVGSPFNDVFGFFVNGTNIALIPGTATPVAINNLNCGNPHGTADNYCALFNNNDPSDSATPYDTEADGFTVVLTATTSVNPGLNHIKLAIADAGDRILDSHVLLKSESFVCAPPGIIADIDIKPGSDPNSVPCNSPDFGIPVAILSTADFDATMVDHTTVNFHGAYEMHTKHSGEMKRHEEDVDLDGDIDLVFHFRLGDTDLDCDSVEGSLTGETYDGIPVTGTDALNMIDNGNTGE